MESFNYNTFSLKIMLTTQVSWTHNFSTLFTCKGLHSFHNFELSIHLLIRTTCV